jgi:hypothetical protein
MERPVFDMERGYFDKWEVYRGLVDKPFGPCILPATAVYTAESIKQMLDSFSCVYVKARHAWGGQGVSRVTYRNEIYLWEMQGDTGRMYDSLEELCSEMAVIYPSGEAIVQENAPVATCNDCAFDIRVHMQREVDESWVYAGALARVGGENSIVSNVGISKGIVLPVEDVLRTVVEHPILHELMQRLPEIGSSICAVLDEYHCFDEVGIDLGVDCTGQLWLFEVNTNDVDGGPSHELFSLLPDQRLYEQIRERYVRRNMDTAISLFADLFSLDDSVE